MSNEHFHEASHRAAGISFASGSMQPSSGSGVGPLHHAIDALFRFRGRAILFFLLSMSAVVVALIVCPREYTSEAKMFVRVGRGANVTLDPTFSKGPAATLNTARNAEINSALELMGSRATNEKLIDAIGPEPPSNSLLERISNSLTAFVRKRGNSEELIDATGSDALFKTPYQRDKAIIKLEKNLTIYSPNESNVICVACRAGSPERAQEIVDALVDIFLDDYLRVNSTPGSYEFFENEAETAEKQLRDETVRLQQTKSEYALASVVGRRTVLEKQIGLIEQQLNANETDLLATQARIAALKGEVKDLPDALAKQIAAALPEAAANSKRQQLYNLQKREQELVSKYGEGHPELIAIRKQIKAAEETLTAEQPDRAQATSGVLWTELVNEKGLSAQGTSLAQQYKRIHEELKTLNEQEVGIVELERSIAVLEAKHQTYLQNLDQSRIDRELEKFEITNINVIQPASLRLKATSPNKGITLLLGFIVSTLGALALPIFSDQRDTTLRSSDQIEQCLGAPVLLTMPRTKSRPVITYIHG